MQEARERPQLVALVLALRCRGPARPPVGLVAVVVREPAAQQRDALVEASEDRPRVEERSRGRERVSHGRPFRAPVAGARRSGARARAAPGPSRSPSALHARAHLVRARARGARRPRRALARATLARLAKPRVRRRPSEATRSTRPKPAPTGLQHA